jgi:hypothetical protein
MVALRPTLHAGSNEPSATFFDAQRLRRSPARRTPFG